MQQQGELIVVDHGGRCRQTAAAARAGQDIDGEDPREELGPADAARFGGRGIVGRWPRQAAVVVEQGELRRGRRRPDMDGCDGAAKVMAIGKHAGVANHVKTGRRDESDELGDELLGTHVHDAVTSCNVESNATVGQPMHGVGSKGRAQQVPAQALESFAVAPVDGGGSMQIHAEAVHVQRGRCDSGRCARGRCRQCQLDARGDARVDVDVVVG